MATSAAGVTDAEQGTGEADAGPQGEKILPTSANYAAILNEPALLMGGYETVQVAQSLPPGTRIGGDYILGMTTSVTPWHLTYAAYDENLDILVLIKEFYAREFVARQGDGTVATRPDIDDNSYQAAMQKFLDRGRALVRFRHPNVIRARRLIEENNTTYLVLDFDYGQTLHSWLISLKRRPSQSELDQLVAPLLDAVALIHQTDYLHRNINPETIFIKEDGSVLLRGFEALGQTVNDGQHGSDRIESAYASPEVAADLVEQQGPLRDIYGIASALHQAVTGVVPEAADSRVDNNLQSVAELAPGGFRSSFLAAIHTALAVKPEDRPQSINTWAEQLGCGVCSASRAIMNEPDGRNVASQVIHDQAGQRLAAPSSNDQQTLFRPVCATTRKISLPDAAVDFLTKLTLSEDEAGASGFSRWSGAAFLLLWLLAGVILAINVGLAIERLRALDTGFDAKGQPQFAFVEQRIGQAAQRLTA